MKYWELININNDIPSGSPVPTDNIGDNKRNVYLFKLLRKTQKSLPQMTKVTTLNLILFK